MNAQDLPEMEGISPINMGGNQQNVFRNLTLQNQQDVFILKELGQALR